MGPLFNAINNSWHKHVENQERTYSLALTAVFKVFRDIICGSTVVLVSLSEYGFYALKNRVKINQADQRKAAICWQKMEEAQKLFEDKSLEAWKNLRPPEMRTREEVYVLQNKIKSDMITDLQG